MLETKLTKSILKTTDNYIKALNKAGIITISDFLNHFPRDYEDRTNVLTNFSLVNIKEKNTILLKLISINSQRSANNKLLTKAVLEDEAGFLAEAVWFNRKYLASQLENFKNKKIIITGKAKYAYGKLSFVSPEVETNLEKISGEIVPIYSELNYIPTKWIKTKIELLKKYITQENFKENLPEEIIKKYDFIPRAEAIYKIHFPKNNLDIELAKKRLSYEELYFINYKQLSKKFETFKESEGHSIKIDLDASLVKKIISKLEFSLTDKQKIVLFQILKDMEKTHSMSRLLEGDVGTGKTIVALISAIHVILAPSLHPLSPSPLGGDESEEKEVERSGNQVAFMAPTEILARQHFEGSQNLLMEFGIKSALLVGSTTKKQKEIIKKDLVSGQIDIVFGTHALVQEDVFFKKLAYVIIDEQHRFGVKQREVLEKYKSQEKNIVPHVLNMTATPIPRTLALTLYGDQDLSIINEYPKGRKEIFTKVIKNDTQRGEVEKFIRNELEKGRQVFWISPLVEESEKIDLANAINTFKNLVEVFAPFKVGLLHGKMKAKEKEQIMQDFKENKIQILSSTSVVEVGVDVPNATIMCIEGAERFGLSQLHQFRGRVGRGKFQSYCYLFPTTGNATDRLRAMEKTNNGFELSEIDLELRGPGEVYGVRQSGVPDLKVASLTDLDLISQIREDIEEFLKKKNKT